MNKFEQSVKYIKDNALTQQDIMERFDIGSFQSHKLNLLLKDFSHRLFGRILYDKNDLSKIKKTLNVK